MRESYREDLNGVVDDLVGMTERVRHAVRLSTQALLEADLVIAEQVISDDALLDAQHDDLESRCFVLLARQAPVAGELRTIVAAMRMVADLARMGDLACHVAKIARLRSPTKAVPEGLVPNFELMARVAEDMVATAGRALHDRNAHGAAKLAASDEEMGGLGKSQFAILLGSEWPYTVEAVVVVALLGRYYERIADHSVIMAGRVIYVVTGNHPAGENWTYA